MNDFLNFFSELLVFFSNSSSETKSVTLRRAIFYTLFFAGLIWLVLELIHIFKYQSLITFSLISVLGGIIISICNVILCYKIGMFNQFKDYRLIFLTTILLVVPCVSFINRKLGKEDINIFNVAIIDKPSQGENITIASIEFDTKIMNLRLDKEIGKYVKKGDSIQIKFTKGFFGFNFVSFYEP